MILEKKIGQLLIFGVDRCCWMLFSCCRNRFDGTQVVNESSSLMYVCVSIYVCVCVCLFQASFVGQGRQHLRRRLIIGSCVRPPALATALVNVIIHERINQGNVNAIINHWLYCSAVGISLLMAFQHTHTHKMLCQFNYHSTNYYLFNSIM